MNRSAVALGVLLGLFPGWTSPGGAVSLETALVSGIVWRDDNLNGMREAVEPTVPGAWVGLLEDNNCSGGGDGRVGGYSALTNEEGTFSVSVKAHRCYSVSADYWVSVERNLIGALVPATYSGSAGSIRVVDPRTNYRVSIRLIDEAARRQGCPPLDWPVSGGHAFKQGLSGTCGPGLSVTNDNGVPFWDEWRRLGIDRAGYPISQRFLWDSRLTQVFERTVLQWEPHTGMVSEKFQSELPGFSVVPGEATLALAAERPPEPWVGVSEPTSALGPDDLELRLAEPGEWYWIVHREGDWVLALGEHDPPELLVWIKLDGEVEPVIVGGSVQKEGGDKREPVS